jgi:predicted Fe-Mo cluster-binding NifX family protein
MRICITAKGPDPENPMDERFGRAAYFLIYDQETGVWKPILNPFADTAGGVGPRAAQILAGENVKALITGNVGGKALSALQAAGISIYLLKERVRVKDALDYFTKNRLTQLV